LSGISHAVFLSYASQDAEAAQKICEALRAAGIEVFLDQSELRGGDAWDQKIRQQIRDCALFVPIISAHTQARPEGYFRLEWKLAVDRSHLMAAEKAFLVPVVVDATREPEALVPTQFRDVQWTRIPAGEVPAAFVDRIAALLNPLVVPHVGSPERRVSRAPAGRLPIVLTAVSVAAVVALVTATAIRGGWLWHKPVPRAEASIASAPVATTPAAIPEKSVAVLPFLDMSEKKDQEYFADGLSEELIDMLTKVTELRVPARTSSFYFKGKQATIADIAKALSVAHVLEGSVRKSGNRLRVTTQLVRADNGYHLWSETYDRQLDDIFKVQDEIADSVIKALKVSLFGGEMHRAAVGDAEAYNSLLLARFHHYLGTKADTKKAIEYYQQAVSLDPTSAPAWAGLSRIILNAYLGGTVSREQAHKSALRAAKRALTLDKRLAEAHIALGRIWFVDWDWPAAQTEFNTAHELDPHYSWASVYAGDIALTLGHVDESVQYYRDAITQDPLNHWPYARIVEPYRVIGRFAEMEEAARKALELSPVAEGSHAQLGMAQLLAGRDPASALAEIARDPDFEARKLALAWAYQVLGRKVDADTALAGLEATGASLPYEIACLYAMRGELDRALLWLDRAYMKRAPSLIGVMVDPDLENLRHDVRYKAFLRKMRLSE
jgi:adenylate cyclase